ncbi:MAG TPA: VOC family protein [Dehalococcoidia bacterium]|nr:VOC family protein [Dehalococcoidia bacterium]
MARISNLNHAVLFVSDPERSARFYENAFGFEVVDRMGDSAIFMKAAGGANHHDLGLFRARGGQVVPGNVGLYHLAWEVETIEELAEAARSLGELGALRGMSDHGVSKSLYGADPDGIEFEVMWRVPREAWGEYERRAVTMPLDLARELQRFAGRPRGA